MKSRSALSHPYLLSLVIFAVFSVFALSGCNKEDNLTPESSDGARILKSTNGWGNGVNLQPSYYNNGYPNFGWSLMKANTKIKTVRIEIDPTRVTAVQAKSWILGARNNGYNVICTYHHKDKLGSDNSADLLAAANWWKANYTSLIASGSFTINLMNEWGSHKITADAYASAYNSAISIVRSVYSGTIIIDAPGYGQETLTVYKSVVSSAVKITDTNIVFSLHVYPNGWNEGRKHNLQAADLNDLSLTGRGAIIGEFGNSPAGNTDWSGIVNSAKSKGWTILGWCWNGDGSTMNMCSPSWAVKPAATSFTKSSYWTVIYNKL